MSFFDELFFQLGEFWGSLFAYVSVGGISFLLLRLAVINFPVGFTKSSDSARRRRMSFISQILSRGAFPEPQFNCADPIVHTILSVENLPSRDALERLVRTKLVYDKRFWRLRSFSFEHSEFEIIDPDDVDVSRHIVDEQVNDSKQMHQLITKLMTNKFESDCPPWAIHRISNQTGSNALLVRVHHVLGDGLAQVDVFSKLVTTSDMKPFEPASFQRRQRPVSKSLLMRLFAFCFSIISMLTAVIQLLLVPLYTDTKHALNPTRSHHSGRYKLNFSPRLSLDYIKRLKAAASASPLASLPSYTVNDVIMAALAGALRLYVKGTRQMQDLGKLRQRVLLPFAFPRSSEEMHNLWCMLSVPLPAHEGHQMKRLDEVARRMIQMKNSPAGLLQILVQRAIGAVSAVSTQKKLSLDLFQQHTLVFSNVPGAQERVYICGELVQRMQVFMPNAIAQSVCLSYNGALDISLVLEDDIERPQLLLDSIADSLQALGDELAVPGSVRL